MRNASFNFSNVGSGRSRTAGIAVTYDKEQFSRNSLHSIERFTLPGGRRPELFARDDMSLRDGLGCSSMSKGRMQKDELRSGFCRDRHVADDDLLQIQFAAHVVDVDSG